MTYIVVTDNLIENLDNLEIDELKYEKIKHVVKNWAMKR